MRLISIKFKNNISYYFNLLLLVLFSFYISYYYGFKGIIPLDDFVNLNSGYRFYTGDLPFKDYYEITGPVLSILQGFLFKVFGLSWKTFVFNSAIFNCLTSLIIFFCFLHISKNKNLSLIIAILFSLLFYPNNGVPGVDHHAWSLALISLLLFYIGLETKKFVYIFFSILALFLSFFIKQVPSSYILVLIALLYIFQSYKEKRIIHFFKIILTTLFIFTSIFLLIKMNEIDFNLFFQQYFLMLINFSGERIDKINLYWIKQNISQIYFLFFLIFPALILLFGLKHKISLNEKKIFLLIFSLILICILYEIHTNNQAITFALIPIICGFLYSIQNKIKKNNFLNYIYIILISLCILKIIQYKIFYIFPIIIFFVICFFYLKKNKNFSISLNFLLVIYLLFSSFYYFGTNVNPRLYKDIEYEKNIISFDGSKIDKFFQDLNWRLNSEVSEELFIKKIKSTISFLKELNQNYIFITDYQFYNLILNKKDFSPVKYWATEISYPSKKNKLRKNFEAFFLRKMLNNNIEYIIVDQNTSVFKESILDFSFLSECLESKFIDKDLKLEIYKFRFNCFEK